MLVLIDRRTLVRETLQAALASAGAVAAYPDPEAWGAAETRPPDLIVLSIGQDCLDSWRASLEALIETAPVMLISDLPDTAQVLAALGLGVRGYLCSDESLSVMYSAITLIRAGGSFVSAALLQAASGRAETPVERYGLSARQKQIVEGIRVGKPNKILAYELGMQESTVKVHIRNIMRKMRARNRTEVAFLLSQQNGRMIERRRAERRETEKSAQLRCGNGPSIIGCTVRNLSQIGACLELDRSVPVSPLFNLVFDSDGAVKTCRIVWRAGKRTGVRFV